MKKILLLCATALVALSSCCSSTKQSENRVNILAHRGFCTCEGKVVTDENSLDALRRAQEFGCMAVEFDVHLTADGKLVIRHDNKIADGLSCQESNFDDIRAFVLPFGNRIPTLHEWLEQAKTTPGLGLFLEIKNHATRERENECVRLIIEEVKAMEMESQVKYLSFSAETCDEILRINPAAKVTLNSSSLHNSMTPQAAADRGYAGISYQSPVFLNHPSWVGEAKVLGLDTFFWMVNCTYLRDIAADLGCSWITSDFYDVVKY